MSEVRPQIIFHIGQHKTGSKALQSFLAHNTIGLKMHGILYPVEKNPTHKIPAYARSQFSLYVLLRKEALIACGELGEAERFWSVYREFCGDLTSLHEMFAAIESQRAQIGAHTVVISAEDLFDMQSTHALAFSLDLVRAAAKILSEIAAIFCYKPTIFVYLRRQDHLLLAHYAQFIKGSAVNVLGFQEFAQAFAPRLKTRDILMLWVAAFGQDNIKVQAYEPAALPEGVIPNFFLRALNFAVPGDWRAPPADVESLNITPSCEYIEFMRVLNVMNMHALSVFSRQDVLQAAFRVGKDNGQVSWLGAKERCRFLDAYTSDNLAIARMFLPDTENGLFIEALPADDQVNSAVYKGLSLDRAIGISRDIHVLELQKMQDQLQAQHKRQLLVCVIGCVFVIVCFAIFWAVNKN